MTKLYRPVGLHELALIWDSGCREFPPRLPDQPIFYPVTSLDYATQIARDWNTKTSTFAGYVTSFDVDGRFLDQFERHIVGSAIHEEYWIPAEQLGSFNHALLSLVGVEAAFFGESFVGYVPDQAEMKGKNATEQFLILARAWDYSRMDFALDVAVNRKAVYLNCPFWLEHEFSGFGLTEVAKYALLSGIYDVWTQRQVGPELPSVFLRGIREK